MDTSPKNWITVNVDGAHNLNNHNIVVGGVARDSSWNFIEGFSNFIGIESSVIAEAWAAVIGLKMICDLKIACVL